MVTPACVLLIAPVVVRVPEVVVDGVELELDSVVTVAPTEKEGVEEKTWLIFAIATNSMVYLASSAAL